MSGMMNALASDAVAIGGVINPDANAAGALTSGWIDMGKFDQALGIVLAGTLGASATLDAKLQQATDSSGTGAKDIAGKAISQLTAAGTDSDKETEINLRASEMDIEGGFSFAAIVMTTAVATSDSAALILGLGPRHGPASDHDVSTVDEIVN